ncbi:zincin [Mycena rosella]|uniref:Zincin n=1 Tax=Mycena rosella TaxID=1033263 RepID=A0AAD7DKA1_MYCRO|nr:zincin [Mycena rosella]
MLTTTSLTFLLTASVVLGGPTIARHRGCATHIEPEDIVVAERHFDANKTEAEKIANTAVKVYWHVISKDSTLAGGNIPDSQIASQIQTLNSDYAGNITWTLANTNRTVNADWFNNAGPSTSQQTAMKASRQGGKGDLNVYSVGFVNGSGAGLLGYSTFPSSYSGAPQDDGIVILFSSVPGGSTNGYNLGRTLTHESGHWLGLYHTFQGGCAGSGTTTAGDYVADTPAESSAASGCPSGRDTCTGTSFPGADPVTNFMDYSSDACMTQFSAGQMARATTQFSTYRT